ncbi:MAG TPA: hypothetical protein VHT34_01830 [Clostridia bacterium]|nr:hypothetical protein [Clostridia bacterium]
MIVIKINRVYVLVSIIVIAVVISAGILAGTHHRNATLDVPAYKTDSISFRLKSFLNSDRFLSQGRVINIEVFDVSQGKVVNRIQSTDEIQKETQKYLEDITGMYPKVKAFPVDGYIARIPLEMPVMLQSQWLKNIVNEVFVIFPAKEKPYLLILDEKSRPLFYTFKGDTGRIRKALGLQEES